MTNLPTLDPLDRRLSAFDNDIADASLRGRVDSKSFVQGTPARISVAFTELRAKPSRESAIDTQLMFGEDVTVFNIEGEWSWVKAKRDGYVGWLESSTLSDIQTPITHLVSVPRTFMYPEPDIKLPHKGMRSMGSALVIDGFEERRGTKYAITEAGEAVVANHVRAVDDHAKDYVAIAETLLLTPYLWAGTTAFGLDCSGLVKLCLFMCGHNVLRDSDMQAATLGEEIDPGEDFGQIKRGDFIFWRGHVGIAQGDGDLIHANGHSMNVASEPLAEAISRIEYLYEKPIGVRRLLSNN